MTDKQNRPRRPTGPSESARKQVKQKLDNIIEEDIDLSEEELQDANEDDTSAIDQGKISEEKQLKRKKQIKYGSILAVIVVLGYLFSRLFIPYQGHQTFAICKTFLELNVEYPSTLRLNESVTRGGNKVRIWFSHIDGFGQYKIQQIECIYGPDETLPYVLESVAISSVTITDDNRDRWEVDADKVRLFNKAALPYLINADLDLTLPWPLPTRISELKFDTHLFRRPLF